MKENRNVIVIKYCDDDNIVKQESIKIIINDKVEIAIDRNFIIVRDEFGNLYTGNRLYFYNDSKSKADKSYNIQTEWAAYNINYIKLIIPVENKFIIFTDSNDVIIRKHIDIHTI